MVEPNMEGEQLEGQDDEAKRGEDVPPAAEGGSKGFVGVPFPSSTGSPPSEPPFWDMAQYEQLLSDMEHTLACWKAGYTTTGIRCR